MLTRDIDLGDSIMDLLDNCVDGILRQLKQTPRVQDSKLPYDGFWAQIIANRDTFSIMDNCGGIPRDIAVKSAFRLGRLETDRDTDIATVGMYGIGMKRALFKLGSQTTVNSRHDGESYSVEISSDWINNDDLWDLPLTDTPNSLQADGTQIIVSQLHEPIAHQFDETESTFVTDLKENISSFYSLILQKGFHISVNGEELAPVGLGILVPADFTLDAVPPYAYRGTFDGVDIQLFIGFYRRLATEPEIDDEQNIPRKSDNAGWTVICNDRVVLYRDKSPITGWGSDNVPKYHPQFIAIAGVVMFYSDQPLNLPLNTTKRGLDTSSPIYWHTRRFMLEGLKKFTDFTYHWKGQEDDTNTRFQVSVQRNATEVIQSIPATSWKHLRGSEGERFVPDLPRPQPREAKRRISFMRLQEEIALLGEHYFTDRAAKPAEIGNQCFDEALERAREVRP